MDTSARQALNALIGQLAGGTVEGLPAALPEQRTPLTLAPPLPPTPQPPAAQPLPTPLRRVDDLRTQAPTVLPPAACNAILWRSRTA